MSIEFTVALASLAGALVGAVASIATTALSNRHGSKLANENRKSKRVEKIKNFQFDNYLLIQERGLRLMRSTVPVFLQLSKQYAAGVSYKDSRVSEDEGELCRQCAEDFVLCEERIADDSLREEAKRLRFAAGAVTHESQDLTTLEQSEALLKKAYDSFADKIGEAIRESQSERWYETKGN